MTDSRPERNYRIEVSQPVLLGGGGHAPAELDLSPGRPDYVTADGVEVWMERRRQKTRFLDCHGGQVGPVHSNLAPAVIWARAQGWRDPSLPQWFNDAVIAEVSAGGAGVDGEALAPAEDGREASLPGAVPGWPPTCPDDGRELQCVLYKQVRHFRCPVCRMVYYSVSGRVGETRGRLSLRSLKVLSDAAQTRA